MPTVQTGDVETYYERRGRGPPVVFVHAAIMDHAIWEPQVDSLAEEYTTVVYDVRGHGRTGGSTRERYSIDLYVRDLHALLDALGIDRAVLCGLSMGGLVAAACAARYPDRVAGLVLADTFTSRRLHWRDRFTYASLRASILPVRLLGLARIQRTMVWAQERFNPAAGGDYGTIEQLQAAMPPIPADEFAKIVRSMTDAGDIAFSSIAAPTLVLYGEYTTGMVRRHTGQIAVEIPDVTVREVPTGGHACNLDNPEFFTGAVRDHLDRVFESGAGDANTGSDTSTA